jgi:hypothetical protein
MLSIGRIYGPGGVRAAAKHNLRELAAEIGADSHIDVERIADNFILRGQDVAADVALEARTLMDKAGVTKVRKNAVMAIELLFMLPPHTSIDKREYFERATTWAEAYFNVPILSSVVHLDESAPHCHVLLLPLVAGKMNGSDLHGGKAKLWAMQKSFHQEVSAAYGFVRQEPRKRASVTSRAAAIKQLRNYFHTTSKMSASAIEALLMPHAQDPHKLLQALGISEQPLSRAPKSFVEIMTAPCKPERRNASRNIANYNAKTINAEEPRDSIPYTCVGKGSPLEMSPPIGYMVLPPLQTELAANRVVHAGYQQAHKHQGTMSAYSSLNDRTALLQLYPGNVAAALGSLAISLGAPTQPPKGVTASTLPNEHPTIINAVPMCNLLIELMGATRSTLRNRNAFVQAIAVADFPAPQIARGCHHVSTWRGEGRLVMSSKDCDPDKAAIGECSANKATVDAINARRALPMLVRQVKYLNNIVDQDHCAIKRLTKPMLNVKLFRAAGSVLAGIELMHMIRKGQFTIDGADALSFLDQFSALAGMILRNEWHSALPRIFRRLINNATEPNFRAKVSGEFPYATRAYAREGILSTGTSPYRAKPLSHCCAWRVVSEGALRVKLPLSEFRSNREVRSKRDAIVF